MLKTTFEEDKKKSIELKRKITNLINEQNQTLAVIGPALIDSLIDVLYTMYKKNNEKVKVKLFIDTMMNVIRRELYKELEIDSEDTTNVNFH
jgi:hypothetical protein